MEPLFTADIIINGHNEAFDVFFHDEGYHFECEGLSPDFTISRIEDEWKVAGDVAEIAQDQAIAALERYLLSQH